MGALDMVLNQSKKKLDRAGIKQESQEVTRVVLYYENRTISLTSPVCVKVTVPNQGTFYQVYYGSEQEVQTNESNMGL